MIFKLAFIVILFRALVPMFRAVRMGVAQQPGVSVSSGEDEGEGWLPGGHLPSSGLSEAGSASRKRPGQQRALGSGSVSA